jgi:hypothetical protein
LIPVIAPNGFPQTNVRRMVVAFAPSAQANSQECQPGTGSLWAWPSNSFSRPSIGEYLGCLFVNHVVR